MADNPKPVITQRPHGPPPRRETSSLTKTLPADRISFDKQVEILKAFAVTSITHDGRAVSNEEAGAALTPPLSAGTVILTNAFFRDVGLLIRPEEGDGFKPSQDVVDYAKALQWDESEARGKLRPVFERTWFYKLLAPRLQLAPQAIKSCIALLAGESNASPEHEDRLQYLLNFLKLAGIVSISNDIVKLTNPTQTPPIAKPQDTQDRQQNGKGDTWGNPKGGEFTLQEEHSVYLDKEKQRRFSISGPLFITRAEYNRICKWIEVTLIVEGEEQEKH